MAFLHLAASSYWHMFCTTNQSFWERLALFQTGLWAPRLRPPLLCLITTFACSFVSDGVHFLPVSRMGATWATDGSLASVIITSLTLAHLYSSKRLEMGSYRTAVEPYTAESLGKNKPLPYVSWSASPAFPPLRLALHIGLMATCDMEGAQIAYTRALMYQGVRFWWCSPEWPSILNENASGLTYLAQVKPAQCSLEVFSTAIQRKL